MLLVDTVLYAVLTWYIEAVMPGWFITFDFNSKIHFV